MPFTCDPRSGGGWGWHNGRVKLPGVVATLLGCAVLFAGTAAWADGDDAPQTQARWPLAYVDRPQTLPGGMFEVGATALANVPNQPDNISPITGNAYRFQPSLSLGVALSAGLTDRLQVGVAHPRLLCFGDTRESACNPTNRNSGLGAGLGYGFLRGRQVQGEASAGVVVTRSSPFELSWQAGAAFKFVVPGLLDVWLSGTLRRAIDPPVQDLVPDTFATVDAGLDLQVTQQLLMFLHVDPWAPVARLSDGVALEVRGGASYTFSRHSQLALSAGSYNVLSNPRWNTNVPEWFTLLSLVSWVDLRQQPAGIMAP